MTADHSRRLEPALDLTAYFERIGYDGTPRADEETLFALHAAHLSRIPYENLDIQLDQPKRLDERLFEERLVTQRRGGWCYEMNGLFSAALDEIGFRVKRVGGAVVRDVIGEASIGNHMVLIVDLGRPFVADVGLGDGPEHPFPLEVRSWSENDFCFALEKTEDGWWRFQNHEHGLAPRFDFTETARSLDWYQNQCQSLQTGEDSPFLGLAMTFRRDPKRIRALRDTTYLEIEGSTKNERRISSLREYREILGSLMDLDLGADVERLWQRVEARAKARRDSASDLESTSTD